MTSLIMTHAIVYAIVNSIYYIFYHFEFTYFEQFRTEKVNLTQILNQGTMAME